MRELRLVQKPTSTARVFSKKCPATQQVCIGEIYHTYSVNSIISSSGQCGRGRMFVRFRQMLIHCRAQSHFDKEILYTANLMRCLFAVFSSFPNYLCKKWNRQTDEPVLFFMHIIETCWLCVLRAWFHILGVGNFFSSSPSVYSQNQICVFHIFVVCSHCVIYNVWCVMRVCVMYIYATVQPNKSWETTKHIHTEIFGWLWQLTMCVRFINSDCLHGILPVKCIHNPIV